MAVEEVEIPTVPTIVIGRVLRRGHSSGGYSSRDIERLVDGWFFDPDQGHPRPAGGSVPQDDGSWLLLRSNLERFGHIDSEETCEVLDIERAVTALQKSHPVAAMTLALVMFGWDPAELERDLGRFHRPATTHLDRGIAYCRAYLSGDDPERAFLAAKPRDIPSSRA